MEFLDEWTWLHERAVVARFELVARQRVLFASSFDRDRSVLLDQVLRVDRHCDRDLEIVTLQSTCNPALDQRRAIHCSFSNAELACDIAQFLANVIECSERAKVWICFEQELVPYGIEQFARADPVLRLGRVIALKSETDCLVDLTVLVSNTLSNLMQLSV